MNTVLEPQLDQLDERVRVPLALTDRCDRCGAQAFVRVFLPRKTAGKWDLDFCQHHYRYHEPAIVAKGYEIQDETNRINEKPGE